MIEVFAVLVSMGDKKDGKSINERFKEMDAPTLVRIMKGCNVFNALFLITSAVLVFVLYKLTVPIVLSAIYVICFSWMLICFELRLKRFDKIVYKNFGFMFSWIGRLIFFFFTGTLAFGLGALGIAAGSITIINVLFNIYVLRTNTAYHASVNEEGSSARQAAADLPTVAQMKAAVELGSVAVSVASDIQNSGAYSSSSTAGSAYGSTPAPTTPTAAPMAASPSAVPSDGVKGPSGNWEKFLDEATGTHYYYNAKTKETRWEQPPDF